MEYLYEYQESLTQDFFPLSKTYEFQFFNLKIFSSPVPVIRFELKENIPSLFVVLRSISLT